MDEKYKAYYKENSRHLEEGTTEIMFKPWNHFDVVTLFAANSPHPLKYVKLGYGFIKDFPIDNGFVETSSISTDVTSKVMGDGIKITILSYTEAVKRAKEIEWSKVKIER